MSEHNSLAIHTASHSDEKSNIDAAFCFHLTFFSESGEMTNLWIPKNAKGVYRFPTEPANHILYIEATNEKCIAHCIQPAFFKNILTDSFSEVPLKDGQLIEIEHDEETCSLYVEQITREKMVFRDYPIVANTDIKIGNQPDADIRYYSQYYTGDCAVLSRRDGIWQIQDFGSIHGVYLNNQKVKTAKLSIGDLIYIMGLRIIIGTDFIAINDGSDRATVNPRILKEHSTHATSYSHYSGQSPAIPHQEFFNRSPRKYISSENKTIIVEAPPVSMERAQMPLFLRMGGSMVMSGYAALAGNFTSMISSVLFPLLSSKYTDKQKEEYEAKRTQKYTEYLEHKRQEILSACEEEKNILNKKYPPIQTVLEQTVQKHHLWERRPEDSDFLTSRLGFGEQRLSAVIDYPQRHFELELDALEEKMYELVEKTYFLSDVPIVLSLTEDRVLGCLGDRQNLIPFVKQLVAQIVSFHSYDEVKLVFFADSEELGSLEAIRYLPHVWDDQKTVRLIATNESEAYKVGEYLKAQLVEDKNDQQELQQILKHRPYYLIFALNKKLFECHEVWKSIVQSDGNHGASVITVYDEIPKECKKIILIHTENQCTLTSLQENMCGDIAFSLDSYDEDQFAEAMQLLANTHLKIADRSYELPKKLTFLEMMKAGRVEHLNSLARWRESNPVASLEAPVGIGTDGSVFTLDLHERRQGPHGLVAGMTGSGKSEFLITYILSLAVNYHPHEVSFVLIDYKGGGLAGAFENPLTGVKLPHLVGTITNLDGATIQRSLLSIESELKRRQRLFNEVKSSSNEGTMDIYTYQRLYRAGKVSVPLPHLFIISDEFAELKQQQPEFIEQLISAARIGRSLGIHLILATQKPSGVVNDQIRSNTKFRVCLRVQERSDSMDMLKRPEAAELTDTGRFYLQVGYNEFFALGQSAWCGAPYEAQETVKVQKDHALEFLDITGQHIAKISPKVKRVSTGEKQIVAVVKYLSDLAKEQGIVPQQLWQPELPSALDLDELQDKYSKEKNGSMSVCLGLLDDPENQTQYPLILDMLHCKNILAVGSSGSGKTSFLNNIILSLSAVLSPQLFQFYVLDYSSRTMKQYKNLPHCGAVLYEEDLDSLDNFFDLINSIVAERKKLFLELGVDGFDDAIAVSPLPLVLVLIDNLASMSATKQGETHNYKLAQYLKDSAHYGVKYIISCNHLNEVPSRAKIELQDRISFHMKDRYDYGEMLGCKVTYLPPDKPGRGLYVANGRPLEFQGSLYVANLSPQQRLVRIKEHINTLQQRYGTQYQAKRLPFISPTATYEDFSGQFKKGRIPLGYSKKDNKAIALPLKQFSALSIYLGNPDGTVPILENIISAVHREGMSLWIVKRKENSCFEVDSPSHINSPFVPETRIYPAEKDSISCLRNDLTAEMSSRRAMLQTYCHEQNIDETDELIYQKTFDFLQQNTTPTLVLIESFADFCSEIDSLSALLFDKILSTVQKRNIYVVGCFAPDDYRKCSGNLLYSCFNPQGNIILLGGQFDKQTICDFPQSDQLSQTLPYNLGFMKYRDQLYPLLMPCGELKEKVEDEDSLSIF